MWGGFKNEAIFNFEDGFCLSFQLLLVNDNTKFMTQARSKYNLIKPNENIQ